MSSITSENPIAPAPRDDIVRAGVGKRIYGPLRSILAGSLTGWP